MDINDMQAEDQLSIDSVSRQHLSEAAGWARFLAIMGFIACGIMVVAGVFITILYPYLDTLSAKYSYSGRSNGIAGKFAFVGAAYIVGSVLYLFRCLFLYRFAARMKSGLQEQNQTEINTSFQNLKKMFRYNGIMTIIMVLLYVVILFVVMFGVMNRY